MADSKPSPGERPSENGDSKRTPDAPGQGSGSSTGRYVVVLSDEVFGREAEEIETLRSLSGAGSVASTSDFEFGALNVDQAATADATMFGDLGIGVVSADPERVEAMTEAAARDSRIVSVEPEQVMYALGDSGRASEVDGEAAERVSGSPSWSVTGATREFADTAQVTWGLQATQVTNSPLTGAGISVAVLDTGIDKQHPDFEGRELSTRSFVSGQSVQDANGHGTHCAGTACGPRNPPEPPGSRGYGVAAESEILVGKVLGDQGSGSDTGILAAINWAISNGCRVISMSLGANSREVSKRYEAVGQRALDRGSLIIAAAGNNAERSAGDSGFVGVPANSPSIMAVAALDSKLGIADFSARSSSVEGGQIDIAAPGVEVYSSWPMDRRYNTISGTSMATPHVSGIAALWAERSGARGEALWSTLVRAAQRLELPAADVGVGLVKAPL